MSIGSAEPTICTDSTVGDVPRFVHIITLVLLFLFSKLLDGIYIMDHLDSTCGQWRSVGSPGPLVFRLGCLEIQPAASYALHVGPPSLL